MSRVRSAALAVALLAAGAAAPALAQAPAEVNLTLTPSTAGSGTALTARVRGGDSSELRGRQPTSFVLAAQRGFAFDPAAVAGRCTTQQAQDGACPANALIGTGRAVVLAKNALLPGGQKAFTASLTVHLGEPGRAGDLGTAHVAFSEPETGTKGTAAGRIVPVAAGPYGIELRFEGIGGGMALPPGTTVELQELMLRVGADRVVRRTTVKRVRVKLKAPRRSRSGRIIRTKLMRRTVVTRVRRDLITNPPRCDGTYVARATVAFSDGSSLVRDLSTPCSG